VEGIAIIFTGKGLIVCPKESSLPRNSVLKMFYPNFPDLAKVRNSLLASENINEV